MLTVRPSYFSPSLTNLKTMFDSTDVIEAEQNLDDLYTFTLCREDWERVIKALRDQAFVYTQDSNLAQEKGASDYAELLWEETAKSNALADYLDFGIPEVE